MTEPMTSHGYTLSAQAPSAWTAHIQLPSTPWEWVRGTLTELADTTGWPVAAAVHGHGDEPVTDLLLFRDPSRTHGTPPFGICQQAAGVLVAATGWTRRPDLEPASGAVVALGLRVGYDRDAVVHRMSDAQRLLPHVPMRPVRLVSARRVDDGVRWYHEDGVLAYVQSAVVDAVMHAAAGLGQQQYVVTDLDCDRTYVMEMSAVEEK